MRPAKFKSQVSDFFPNEQCDEEVTAAIRLLESFEAQSSLDSRCDALLQRGMALLTAEDFHAAIHDVNELLQINPHNIRAFLLRARLHAFEGRREKAIADLNQLIRVDPGSFEAHTHRGNLLFQQGSYVDALANCDAALTLDPNNYESLLFRPVCLWFLGLTASRKWLMHVLDS